MLVGGLAVVRRCERGRRAPLLVERGRGRLSDDDLHRNVRRVRVAVLEARTADGLVGDDRRRVRPPDQDARRADDVADRQRVADGWRVVGAVVGLHAREARHLVAAGVDHADALERRAGRSEQRPALRFQCRADRDYHRGPCHVVEAAAEREGVLRGLPRQPLCRLCRRYASGHRDRDRPGFAVPRHGRCAVVRDRDTKRAGVGVGDGRVDLIERERRSVFGERERRLDLCPAGSANAERYVRVGVPRGIELRLRRRPHV